MFAEYFALIEVVAGAFFAVLLAYKYIQRRKNHHLIWIFSMIFWSIFELNVFFHFVYGSTPVTEKTVTLLHMPIMALFGVGMLFLLQRFELFPKVVIQKPWPKYFLVYILIVYSVLIGVVLVAGAQQTATIVSWVLLIIPGAFITVSCSISSIFLGRKRNSLIAIGIFLSIVAEQFWHMGLPAWTFDTIGDTLMGVGFLIATEPSKE